MSDGKAVVYNGKKPVKVDFDNYGTSKIISSPDIEEKFEGILVIFNSNESLVRKDLSVPNELVEGLASEVSLSLTLGWKNCYFCSFEKYADYKSSDLPHEFTTLDEDNLYRNGEGKLLSRYINDSYPVLKKVRFVGVISRDELDQFTSSIDLRDKIELELDSPFLIVIDRV
jgi:hypothetical protein